MIEPLTLSADGSPFDLEDPDRYAAWRDAKLRDYPEHLAQLVVEIADPRELTAAEHRAILDRCRKTNMAIYASRIGNDPAKDSVRRLGLQFGLQRLDDNLGADEDAISSITVQSDALHQGYIPYTNRPIAWHTDGYYNAPDRQIHAMVLHCVSPGASGGSNDLLDHEIAYILLRDQSPEYVRALMHPEAMTIPANLHEPGAERPPRTGPVFSAHPSGHLHMRYTDRSRSIVWHDDPLTQAAVEALKTILHQPSPWHFQGRLEAGQGLIANNVLHTRTTFTDGPEPRLLYRGRYYDRIQGT
jgi:hypothetical protein